MSTIIDILKESPTLLNVSGYINVMIELELYDRLKILVTDEIIEDVDTISYNNYRILYILAINNLMK